MWGMRKCLAAAAMVLLVLTGCSSQDSGDVAACAAFEEAAAATRQAMDALVDAGDGASEALKADYRNASAEHAGILRAAADLASDPDLASDLSDAAQLWEASSGSEDAATAYFLTEKDIKESC